MALLTQQQHNTRKQKEMKRSFFTLFSGSQSFVKISTVKARKHSQSPLILFFSLYNNLFIVQASLLQCLTMAKRGSTSLETTPASFFFCFIIKPNQDVERGSLWWDWPLAARSRWFLILRSLSSSRWASWAFFQPGNTTREIISAAVFCFYFQWIKQWINEMSLNPNLSDFGKTPTLLHAFNEAVIFRQGGLRVRDPIRDPQFLSDKGVFEQGHLTQGEAVGGQPVSKNSLRFVWGEKETFRRGMWPKGIKMFKLYFLVLPGNMQDEEKH